MWNSSIWSDILVAVIGAVLAACLTVLIAYRTFRLQERFKEKTVLTNLIHDLHYKRALRAIHPKSVPGAARSSDYQRTTDIAAPAPFRVQGAEEAAVRAACL